MILFISPKYGARADSVSLIQAARSRGIRTETLLNNWHGISQLIGKDEKVALYGETAFCEFIAQEMQWELVQNSLDWVTRLPQSFLKRSVKYMTLEEVIDVENHSQSILDKRILQSADEPIFSSGIYQTRFPRVPLDTPMLVSTNLEWTAKFRFIIVNKKIVSSCCFQIKNVFNQPVIWKTRFEHDNVDAISFVQNLLEHVSCAPGCVIDVGYIQDVGWSVYNTQPIWTTELYGCDPRGVLQALFAACKQNN